MDELAPAQQPDTQQPDEEQMQATANESKDASEPCIFEFDNQKLADNIRDKGQSIENMYAIKQNIMCVEVDASHVTLTCQHPKCTRKDVIDFFRLVGYECAFVGANTPTNRREDAADVDGPPGPLGEVTISLEDIRNPESINPVIQWNVDPEDLYRTIQSEPIENLIVFDIPDDDKVTIKIKLSKTVLLSMVIETTFKNPEDPEDPAAMLNESFLLWLQMDLSPSQMTADEYDKHYEANSAILDRIGLPNKGYILQKDSTQFIESMHAIFETFVTKYVAALKTLELLNT